MLRLTSTFAEALKLRVELAWLYICIVALTLWEKKWARFLVWLLCLGLTIRQMASGRLSLNDIINEIVLGILCSMPFLR